MNVAQAITRVEGLLDDIIEVELIKGERTMLSLGATVEELEAWLRHYHLGLLAWRRENLVKVRALLAKEYGVRGGF
jgi:hypothetical protein